MFESCTVLCCAAVLTAAAVENVRLCSYFSCDLFGMTCTVCSWPCQAYFMTLHVMHVHLLYKVTCVACIHNHVLHGYAVTNYTGVLAVCARYLPGVSKPSSVRNHLLLLPHISQHTVHPGGCQMHFRINITCLPHRCVMGPAWRQLAVLWPTLKNAGLGWRCCFPSGSGS